MLAKSDFDWGSTAYLYWELALNPDKSLELQLDALREDLVQASYSHGTVLDVGWYPEAKAEGRFVVVVVRDGDWERPTLRHETRSLDSLHDAIARAILVARSG